MIIYAKKNKVSPSFSSPLPISAAPRPSTYQQTILMTSSPSHVCTGARIQMRPDFHPSTGIQPLSPSARWVLLTNSFTQRMTFAMELEVDGDQAWVLECQTYPLCPCHLGARGSYCAGKPSGPPLKIKGSTTV